MKEKSNATLRRAASLRCRTDAAIDRLGKAIFYYERGSISAGELLREASDAAGRAGNLELNAAELAATGSFGQSVNRKVKAYRGYARTAAHIAMGFKSDEACRRQALDLARMAVRLREPLINHRYFITIDKSVRENSLSRAFSGFGFPVIRS